MDLYERLENRLNNRIKQNREEYEKRQAEVQSKRRAYNSQGNTNKQSNRGTYNLPQSTNVVQNYNLPTREQYVSSNNMQANSYNLLISEDFKKKLEYNLPKREQYTPTNSTKVNNYSLPIAEEFKQKLENNKRVKAEEQYSLPTFAKNVSDYLLPTPEKGIWIAKKAGTGVAQGTEGIAQAGMTEVANNFDKGKKKSGNELLKDVANSMTLNPIQSAGDMFKTLAGSFDPTKSWWENVGAFGTNLVSGTINQMPIKKMFDETNQVVGKILPDNASDSVMAMNNAMSKPLEELSQKLDEEGQQYDGVTRLVGNTGQVVGNMAPATIASIATGNPTVGLATMAMSAKGQSTQEALNKGATLDQAIKIGDTKAMIEVGTEMLTGGVNVFGKGALDEIIERGINKRVKNEVVNFLMKKGVDFGGEVVEEVISDLLGTVIDKGTVDPEAKYTWEDFGDTAITTILSTMVLNALGGGYTPKAYRENAQNMQAYKQNQVNNQNNIQTQQTINQDNKISQNRNIEQIQVENYKYIETDNSKINNLRQDMSKYWTNSDETKALGSVIEKLISDKSYNVRLDDTIKSKNGNFINAQISKLNNGEVEIRINPNAKNVGEFLIMHETTHAVNTQEMKNLVMDYASKNAEFNNALESLKKTYGVDDVSDEVLADVSGQLFGNQEFINNLSMEKPSIFKRIYNKIIELANKITGNSKEGLFVRNLANKWQEVYRTQANNLNNDTFYSIQQDNNGNKYVKVDTDQNIFDGKSIQEQIKIARQYILNNFREKGLNYEGGNAKVTSKTANEYTHPKNQLPFQTKQSKIKASTELDNILNISQYKYSANDDGRHSFAKDGWDYYKTTFEVNGVKFEGLINIAKSGNKRTFYDITNIKRISQNRSASDKSFSTSLTNSNNSIPSANTDVNTDTKYSMQESENNVWQSYLDKNFKSTGTRTNLQDIRMPTSEYFKQQINMPISENQVNNIQKQFDYDIPPAGKERRHYKSIIESQYTTDQAKAISRELMGMDTYVPESNKKQLENADRRIEISGADSELKSLTGRTIAGDKMRAEDVAVGERLIQYYSKTGNATQLAEAIRTTAMIGTKAGQTVQAMSLLNHQTPEGQAIWIQRSVEKMNNELRKKKGDRAQQFNFTPEMQQKIVSSQNKQELHNNLQEVYKELGQQVHKSTIEQIDSWRYFAMLGNFRTHIRNMTGNFLMGIAQDTKNKVAGTIEGVVAKFNPEMERTKTIKMPSREVLEFAKQDYKNAQIESENKYNPKSVLEKNMRTFKSDAMENTLGRLFKWNDNLLEAEDGLGLKAGYKKSLAEYITANNIDINNITDSQLAKARSYATRQAEERTFHQANTIASAINSFTRKNKVTKAVGDAILPFVKTPVNVAKTGIEYSPVGLAKSVVLDTVKLRKGDINVNQYIDNISKGLTGSAITVLGYALAQAGILKAGGSDDDKKENFDEQSGKQAYAIQIGDKTYSIDWLAPVGIPLMVGAEIQEGLKQKGSEKSSKSSEDDDALEKFLNRAEVLTNSLTNMLDPMVEMSMISSLVSSLRSFSQSSSEGISAIVTNATKSYINQFVPTLFGQIAKATDTVERDTTSTKTGNLPKAIDGTINQIKYKIPGLRQTLPTRKDIWGEEVKLADNWATRFAEAGILPMTIKQVNNTKVVQELNNLYYKTGESSILPTILNKTLTINSQKYRLTNQEYNKYKTKYGRNSFELINGLVSSEEYKKMTDKQKQSAIEKVYSYVKEDIKMDYAKINRKTCESSALYDTMQYIDKNGGDKSSYLHYLAKTEGIDKQTQKVDILANANYSDQTKKAIYINTVGKDDYNYSVLEKTNINITEYLKYKVQDFESDKKDDGTINGKAVSGSKQKKVVQYLNSMNITGKQRLLLYAINGYKMTSSQKNMLVKYAQGLRLNQKEAMKLYDKFSGFKVYKNGTIKW